jgi:uncharacterized protein (DUF433 family)
MAAVRHGFVLGLFRLLSFFSAASRGGERTRYEVIRHSDPPPSAIRQKALSAPPPPARRLSATGLGIARSGVLRYSLNVSFNYHDHFERRLEVCGGETVIRGTRVTVRTLLASFAEGASAEEILADFPTVPREALRAVIAFAAASAEEDLPIPPAPVLA